MIEKRERVIFGQSGQPEGELGKIDCEGVAVDTVEALLRDAPTREKDDVLVGWNGWHSSMYLPRANERFAEVAAGLDEEGSGAHGRIAHFQIEDLFRPRMPMCADFTLTC